jgi:hypothetical protein
MLQVVFCVLWPTVWLTTDISVQVSGFGCQEGEWLYPETESAAAERLKPPVPENMLKDEGLNTNN